MTMEGHAYLLLTLPPCSASHSRVRSARGWSRNDEINKGTLHAGVQGRGRSSGHRWRAGGDGRQESRLVGADAAYLGQGGGQRRIEKFCYTGSQRGTNGNQSFANRIVAREHGARYFKKP